MKINFFILRHLLLSSQSSFQLIPLITSFHILHEIEFSAFSVLPKYKHTKYTIMFIDQNMYIVNKTFNFISNCE